MSAGQPTQRHAQQLHMGAPSGTLQIGTSRVFVGLLHKHSPSMLAQCTTIGHYLSRFVALCRPVNHYAGTTASSAAAPPANSQPRVMHISQFSGKVELYKGSVSTVYQAQDDWTRHKVILKCYHKKKMQVGG
jgi:hypothetical protein